MQTQNNNESNSSWKLLSVKGDFPPFILNKDKYIIGRSDSADIVIRNSSISSLHAAFLISPNKLTIVDLDSTNGVFVNGNKVEQHDVVKGDIISLGEVQVMIQLADHGESNLLFGVASVNNSSDQTSTVQHKFVLPKKTVEQDEVEESNFFSDFTGTFIRRNVPKLEKPTDLFPEFEFSEFIFEDEDDEELIDIFKASSQKALELIVMHGDVLLDIVYLTKRKKQYFLSGTFKGSNIINVPFLRTGEKTLFIETNDDGFHLHPVNNFKLIQFKSTGETSVLEDVVYLRDRDIYEFKNDDYKLMIKLVDAPPETISAPFFTYDQLYKKLVSVIISLWLLVTLLMVIFKVEKPVVEKKKKVISKVLYKPKKKIKKKEPKKVEEKKEQQNSSAAAGGEKAKDEPKKTTEKKEDVKVPEKVVKKEEPKVATAKANLEVKKKPTTPPKENTFKTDKPVEKPKSNVSKNAPKVKAVSKVVKKQSKLSFSKFSGKLNQVFKNSNSVNLSGSNSNPSKSSSVSSVTGGGALSGGNSNSLLQGESKYAKLSGGGGSNEGTLKGGGKMGYGGTGGVGVSFGSDEYVVMGSIDPRIIQNLLRQYLPQFSFCYEKELERIDKDIRAVIYFNFEIGPTGRVRTADYESKSFKVSRSLGGCFTRVLKVIPFPKPKGGGVVQIKQPFNMEPKF